MGSPSLDEYRQSRVIPAAEFLAGWTVDWGETSASGACPRCKHSMTFIWSTIVAMGGQGDNSTSRRVDCTCGMNHPADGDEKQSCGAFWYTTFYRDESGDAHAAPADNRVIAATEALHEAQQDAQTRLRTAADKWVAGVGAVLALFGIAGTVAGGTILGNLSDTRKGWVLALAAAALVAAVLAILASYAAAYGWPKNVKVSPDKELLAWYDQRDARLTTISDRLRQGVAAAVVSIVLVAAAAAIAWTAPAKASDPTLKVTLAGGSTRCGQFLAGISGGQILLTQSDGSVIPVPLAGAVKIDVVASC